MRFLVTGAARGTGRAVCRQLGESGLAEALQPLVGSLDRLDGLVHSAGIVRGATAALTTADDFTAMQPEVRDLEQAAYALEDYLEVETVTSVITSALLFPPDGELSDVVVRPRRNAVRPVGRHLP